MPGRSGFTESPLGRNIYDKVGGCTAERFFGILEYLQEEVDRLANSDRKHLSDSDKELWDLCEPVASTSSIVLNDDLIDRRSDQTHRYQRLACVNAKAIGSLRKESLKKVCDLFDCWTCVKRFGAHFKEKILKDHNESFIFLFGDEEPKWKTAPMYCHLIMLTRIFAAYDMYQSFDELKTNPILFTPVANMLLYLENVANEIEEKDKEKTKRLKSTSTSKNVSLGVQADKSVVVEFRLRMRLSQDNIDAMKEGGVIEFISKDLLGTKKVVKVTEEHGGELSDEHSESGDDEEPPPLKKTKVSYYESSSSSTLTPKSIAETVSSYKPIKNPRTKALQLSITKKNEPKEGEPPKALDLGLRFKKTSNKPSENVDDAEGDNNGDDNNNEDVVE